MPYVFAYDHRHQLDPADVTLLLGGKAANLTVMAVELGLPVPPAFTITTEACRRYFAAGWPDGLDDEIRTHMGRLESLVGRRFGDPSDPLLVSVRSGAPRSMPGMMDTILNLGLTDGCEAGLAAASGDAAFARDCHERFRAVYRDVVGTDEVPDDPWLQLRGAVEAVFRSWNSDRARTYRAREGISDDLGTGVTVQAMVFGNRGPDSGTGVLFTRNPATGERQLYGDVLFDAQGEDVVSGTRATATIRALEQSMPDVAAELRRHADVLERHFRDCCDIEFTIERGRLWMLQVRVGKRTPQAALRMAVEMADDPAFPLTRGEAVERVAALLIDPPMLAAGPSGDVRALTSGLGASPGIASGEIRLTPDDAVAAADRGADVILVRSETSPDDVHGMGRSRGILTATGGFASHAAVVARGWGIPAVVGASDVVIGDGTVTIAGRVFSAGTVITLNGTTGEVFEGSVEGDARVVPEADLLLDWARELGMDVGLAVPGALPASAPSAGSPATGVPDAVSPRATVSDGDVPDDAPPRGLVSGDDVLRVLVVKGYAAPDAIATAVALAIGHERATSGDDSGRAAVSAVLDRLVAAGLAEPAAGAFRLTAAGKLSAGELLSADAAAWGAPNAISALDAFLALDRRMKDIVTAWQTREVGGDPVVNDHSDVAYDTAVLDRLAGLHRDAHRWLGALVGAPARMALYAARLDRAASLAGRDGRYVASPRVDSYHGVWFELHEDLIRLAGRSRADEVAAGRA